MKKAQVIDPGLFAVRCDHSSPSQIRARTLIVWISGAVIRHGRSFLACLSFRVAPDQVERGRPV
jgi:hypothetical protein